MKWLPYLAIKLPAFNFFGMPMDVYHLSSLLNVLTNILALTIGIFYCYRSSNPSYIRIFPVYLFVSAAIEFLMNTNVLKLLNYQPFGSHQAYIAFLGYNLFAPFELFMFAGFLFQIIRSPRMKKLLTLLLMLFSVFFIIYSMEIDIGKSVNVTPIILESIIIIIPCLTWYRELFTRSETLNLYSTPAFWLVTGIFFYLATIIPFFVTRIYLLGHGLHGLVKTLSSINNFSLVITYILFMKGFTCRIKRS